MVTSFSVSIRLKYGAVYYEQTQFYIPLFCLIALLLEKVEVHIHMS